MGAESIKELLMAIDLEKESAELKAGLKDSTGQKRARLEKNPSGSLVRDGHGLWVDPSGQGGADEVGHRIRLLRRDLLQRDPSTDPVPADPETVRGQGRGRRLQTSGGAGEHVLPQVRVTIASDG